MTRHRVLVVDDEPETVKYLSANLRARGYHVLTAEDGRMALKLFGESLLDLVILAHLAVNAGRVLAYRALA